MRTIVPMRSKNEVLLILQHFDYSVDRTVQAFLEGMALGNQKHQHIIFMVYNVSHPSSFLFDCLYQILNVVEKDYWVA